MARFPAYASPDAIVDELRDDDEEMGEVIGLIAREVARLSEGDASELVEFIVPHGSASDLRNLAALLVQAAIEKEA